MGLRSDILFFLYERTSRPNSPDAEVNRKSKLSEILAKVARVGNGKPQITKGWPASISDPTNRVCHAVARGTLRTS